MNLEPIVRVVDVRKVFGLVPVLDGVSLEIRTGEAVALLGANGAGKTTLLKILATLLRPTRGTATIAGHDVARAPEAVRALLGVVAHGAWVYDDLTARENLKFWATLSGLAAGAALLMVTHSFGRELGVADRLAVLAGGRIALDTARGSLGPDDIQRLYAAHTEDGL